MKTKVRFIYLWRVITIFVLVCFFVTNINVPFVRAQEFRGSTGSTSSPLGSSPFYLPAPGVMVGLSPEFSPAVLKGIKLDPQNPFRFHFFIDIGDTPTRGQVPPTLGHVAEAPIGDRNVSPSSLPSNEALNVKATQRNNEDDDQELRTEATRLIKYFLASLTIPEKDLWVNLSPYEKDRIVPQEFGQTEMGRDLLAEDYLLKQITASLIYPESQLGKEFWAKVYAQAQAKYGTTNIPINTFNKVWIVPEKAVVYENGGTAFVLENHLKVMLEQDYLALEKNQTPTRGHVAEAPIGDRNVSPSINALGSQIVREIVIPALTKEVNEGKNFAQLRQVFYSLILATWYKKKIKDSILNKVYSNRNKIGGVNVSAGDKDRIYQEYLRAFKKGVYNYIKEEADPITNEVIPRKYFSGGVVGQIDVALTVVGPDKAELAMSELKDSAMVDVGGDFNPIQISVDRAMTSPQERLKQWYKEGQVIQHPFPNGLKDVPYVKLDHPEDHSIRELLDIIKHIERRYGWPQGTIVVTGGVARNLLLGRYGLDSSSDIDILIGLRAEGAERKRVGNEILKVLNNVFGLQAHPMDTDQQHEWKWDGLTVHYIGNYNMYSRSVNMVAGEFSDIEPISSIWVDSNATIYDTQGGVGDLLVKKTFRLVGFGHDWLDNVYPENILRAVRFKFEYGLSFDQNTQHIVENIFKPHQAHLFKNNQPFWDWFKLAEGYYKMVQSGVVDEQVVNAYYSSHYWEPEYKLKIAAVVQKIIGTRDIELAKEFLNSDLFYQYLKENVKKIVLKAQSFQMAQEAIAYLSNIGFDRIAQVTGIDFNELLKQRPDYTPARTSTKPGSVDGVRADGAKQKETLDRGQMAQIHHLKIEKQGENFWWEVRVAEIREGYFLKPIRNTQDVSKSNMFGFGGESLFISKNKANVLKIMAELKQRIDKSREEYYPIWHDDGKVLDQLEKDLKHVIGQLKSNGDLIVDEAMTGAGGTDGAMTGGSFGDRTMNATNQLELLTGRDERLVSILSSGSNDEKDKVLTQLAATNDPGRIHSVMERAFKAQGIALDLVSSDERLAGGVYLTERILNDQGRTNGFENRYNMQYLVNKKGFLEMHVELNKDLQHRRLGPMMYQWWATHPDIKDRLAGKLMMSTEGGTTIDQVKALENAALFGIKWQKINSELATYSYTGVFPDWRRNLDNRPQAFSQKSEALAEDAAMKTRKPEMVVNVVHQVQEGETAESILFGYFGGIPPSEVREIFDFAGDFRKANPWYDKFPKPGTNIEIRIYPGFLLQKIYTLPKDESFQDIEKDIYGARIAVNGPYKGKKGERAAALSIDLKRWYGLDRNIPARTKVVVGLSRNEWDKLRQNPLPEGLADGAMNAETGGSLEDGNHQGAEDGAMTVDKELKEFLSPDERTKLDEIVQESRQYSYWKYFKSFVKKFYRKDTPPKEYRDFIREMVEFMQEIYKKHGMIIYDRKAKIWKILPVGDKKLMGETHSTLRERLMDFRFKENICLFTIGLSSSSVLDGLSKLNIEKSTLNKEFEELKKLLPGLQYNFERGFYLKNDEAMKAGGSLGVKDEEMKVDTLFLDSNASSYGFKVRVLYAEALKEAEPLAEQLKDKISSFQKLQAEYMRIVKEKFREVLSRKLLERGVAGKDIRTEVDRMSNKLFISETYKTEKTLVADLAMKSREPGGIDLNPAQMRMEIEDRSPTKTFGDDNGRSAFGDDNGRSAFGDDILSSASGNDASFTIDPAQVTGATFTIRTMTPVTNLPQILGLNLEPANKPEQEILAGTN
jgi:hypothetical protein